MGTRTIVMMAAALICPGSAIACSSQQERLSSAQLQARANQAVKAADLIVDGRVVHPMSLKHGPGTAPIAYLQVEKVLKGRASSDTIAVVYVSSCDVSLERRGERVRILLSGKGVYVAQQDFNWGPNARGNYTAAVDRAIGQRRARGISAIAGAEEPPKGR